MLVDWIEAGGQPDNIDVIAVATATRSTSDNYPPSAWLDREGLDVPTLVDDESATTAAAYGLSAFPFWVFLDGEGVVNARFQGIIPPSELSRLAFSLLP